MRYPSRIPPQAFLETVTTILLVRTEADMTNSSREFERARQCIPGGVNSPVRAFRAVGGTPVFIERAEGALLFDIDGKRFVDYVGTWGPAVVGHAHPRVVEAVREAAARGLSFGAPTVLETEMAERVCGLVPSMDKVRMVSSGTEAGLSAIRLARGFTGRDAIVKFEGCYHGHADSLLVKAGSGALTFGVPTSPGVPAGLAEHTLTLSFNDAAGVREAFTRFGDRIAATIVEPIAGNMNCVPPVPGFLETLRECCDEYGAVLIFDEVMTGFRVAPGGAQSLYGIRPDLTILGKVIGGGMPVGAFGGRCEIMDHIAPDGPVYQAGTLSGNPIAMTAGLTTLEILSEDGFHDRLSATTARLVGGLRERAAAAGIDLATNHVCGMFGLFFTGADEVEGFDDVMACDAARFGRFFHAMLDQGVYLAPSAFEAGFVSIAHGDEHLEATMRAAEKAFEHLAHQSQGR